MRKIAKISAGISISIFVIDWLCLGLKLLDNDYNITIEAYIGMVSLIVFSICILYHKCTNRCPNCKKMIPSIGKYCPYCSKEISK
jgi:hypothetical protein